MNLETETGQWITGEEYNRERRRLLAAGFGSSTPEYQDLLGRIAERNAYIWTRYGEGLMQTHPGRWAAVNVDGEYVLAESELEAVRLARERFGAASSLIARLDETRGVHRIGPRRG